MNCERCELHKTRTKAVFGAGKSRSDIVFVDEAPGKDEDLKGKPFVGRSSKLLDEMLGSIALSRTDVWICNMVKCRPPENRDPLPSEIECCSSFLEKQIEIVQPKIIVTLGRHVMNYFLPGHKISEVHGQPGIKNGRVLLPLYHPAVALYDGRKKEELLKDFSQIPLIIHALKEKDGE